MDKFPRFWKILFFPPIFFAFYCLFVLINREFNKNRESQCFDNLRKSYSILSQYMHDYDNNYPLPTTWKFDLPKKYPDISCPLRKSKYFKYSDEGFPGYALNQSMLFPSPEKIQFSQNTVMISESAVGVSITTGPNPFAQFPDMSKEIERGFERHRNGSNYLFADGHVHWYREQDVKGVDDYDGNDGLRPTFSLGLGIKQKQQQIR
jgi:prepilin-type processing-associated H-X9-DG protein